jgi:phage repressor protein C with HTH and peptisase S24 domain
MRSTLEIIDLLKGLYNVKRDAELSRAMNVTNQTLASWKGRDGIPPRELIRVAEEKHVSLDWLVFGKRKELNTPVATDGSFEEFSVPPNSAVRITYSDGQVLDLESPQIVDPVAFKLSWLAPLLPSSVLGQVQQSVVLVTACDDAMAPTLLSDDLLLVDTQQNDQIALQSGIYVLLRDNVLYARRLQYNIDGSLLIRSDNPMYASETVREEELDAVIVVGRVVWYGRAAR